MKFYEVENWQEILAPISGTLNVPIDYSVERVASYFKMNLGGLTLLVPDRVPEGEITDYLVEVISNKLSISKSYPNALLKALEMEFDPFELNNYKTVVDGLVANTGTNQYVDSGQDRVAETGDDKLAYSGDNVTKNTGTNTNTNSLSQNTYDSSAMKETERNSNTETPNLTETQTLGEVHTTTHGKVTTTERGTTNTETRNTQDKQDTITTITGYSNIDYESAIASVYKTKMLSWYTHIINSITDCIALSEW